MAYTCKDQLHCRSGTSLISGAHQGGHATTRFLEGFLEGSLKEALLRRLPGASEGTEVLRKVLRRGGGLIEGT